MEINYLQDFSENNILRLITIMPDRHKCLRNYSLTYCIKFIIFFGIMYNYILIVYTHLYHANYVLQPHILLVSYLIITELSTSTFICYPSVVSRDRFSGGLSSFAGDARFGDTWSRGPVGGWSRASAGERGSRLTVSGFCNICRIALAAPGGIADVGVNTEPL